MLPVMKPTASTAQCAVDCLKSFRDLSLEWLLLYLLNIVFEQLFYVVSWMMMTCAVIMLVGGISALMAYFIDRLQKEYRDEIREMSMALEKERMFSEKIHMMMHEAAMSHEMEIRELGDNLEDVLLKGLHSNLDAYEEVLKTKQLKAEFQKQTEDYEEKILRLANKGDLKDAHILELEETVEQLKKDVATLEDLFFSESTKKVRFSDEDHVCVFDYRLPASTVKKFEPNDGNAYITDIEMEYYDGHYDGDDEQSESEDECMELKDDYYEEEEIRSKEEEVLDSEEGDVLDYEEEKIDPEMEEIVSEEEEINYEEEEIDSEEEEIDSEVEEINSEDEEIDFEAEQALNSDEEEFVNSGEEEGLDSEEEDGLCFEGEDALDSEEEILNSEEEILNLEDRDENIELENDPSEDDELNLEKEDSDYKPEDNDEYVDRNDLELSDLDDTPYSLLYHTILV
ncbi:hypothetical protein RUND412_003702 [Rhizina undulata]